MTIQVKLCYSPSLGGQLMLTLGSSYHSTPHKVNISRRAKDSLYHTPHKANISSAAKYSHGRNWHTNLEVQSSHVYLE